MDPNKTAKLPKGARWDDCCGACGPEGHCPACHDLVCSCPVDGGIEDMCRACAEGEPAPRFGAMASEEKPDCCCVAHVPNGDCRGCETHGNGTHATRDLDGAS